MQQAVSILLVSSVSRLHTSSHTFYIQSPMSDQTIDSLRAALLHSPDNIPLRMLLADTLFSQNRLDEAEEEYTFILNLSDTVKAKIGLARIFFQKGKFSACNVILETVMESGWQEPEILALYAKALLKEHEPEKAMAAYQRALGLYPSFSDEELDREFRIKSLQTAQASEEETDSRFLQKPSVSFADVGGMDSVKKEIELKIIRPLLHPELYKAYGKKTGGGILLYGPPGCGKTYIAKATAGQVNARFISVSLNDILDMWIGNSEKNLHELFELARKNAPCVLFIDEIDALGASRRDMKHSGSRHLINQFLQELDGIEHNNEGVLVLGATNTPWNLDPAFRRPGRFDRIIFVPPPDEVTRESILRLKLRSKPAENINFRQIAKSIPDYSGADIDALIDIAVEQKLEASFSDGIPKPLVTKDLVSAAKKHRSTTREWFVTAKNFALFANDSGLYDDILSYLNIKK